MNKTKKSHHGQTHEISRRFTAGLKSLILNVGKTFRIKPNLAKSLLLALIIILFICIIFGGVFAIATSLVIGAMICGINVFSSSYIPHNEERSESEHNYGSNGSNGSDGSTGA
ncbi:hypothetical protein [Erwinia sp. S59]|uniref:hypothetical protein n=1 Tax=Erwinia sp. S59 TaxID=2769340 RepID=UPI001909BEE5|nr:hypothetical protein [Erwinia sp. S59]MBK0093454.1 hypothetical protein [Erwinia sp. S59]